MKYTTQTVYNIIYVYIRQIIFFFYIFSSVHFHNVFVCEHESKECNILDLWNMFCQMIIHTNSII